jgi:hypothetical protein
MHNYTLPALHQNKRAMMALNRSHVGNNSRKNIPIQRTKIIKKYFGTVAPVDHSSQVSSKSAERFKRGCHLKLISILR